MLRDVRWAPSKEIAVGMIMDGVMAAVAFGHAEVLGVGMDVGAAVALTIAPIRVWSSAVAAGLPLLLRRAKVDPAVVSAPTISTLVDGAGLVISFSIAEAATTL
jgi:magnesium transporter